MSEMSKYEAFSKKLQGVCDENNLVFRFRNNQYPLTLTIRPVNGMEEQMSMLADAEDNGYTSPDAYIVFAYKDGALTYKTSETFSISDALFSKIKNLYKNMHAMWLQYFYRSVVERNLLLQSEMPNIEEDKKDSDDGADDSNLLVGATEGEPEDPDEEGTYSESETSEEETDELYDEAVTAVREAGTATVGLLQLRLKIGYSRAARIMDDLEKKGVVGPFNGSQPREVIQEPDSGNE